MDIALTSEAKAQKGLGRSSMVVTFGFLFLTWGFLSVLNYVLLERFRDIFEIKYSISSLISITFFATYLIMSLLAGRMVTNWGYKLSLIIGIYVAAVGCMLLHFAVTVHNYYFFLFSFFLQAVGVTCLQVAANLYIVQWGNPLKAPSRLSFIQAFNSLGAVLAPVFGSKFVTDLFGFTTDEALSTMTNNEYMQSITSYIQTPYIIISILLFFLTIFFVFVDIPEFDSSNQEPMNFLPQNSRRRHVLHFRQLRLGAFAIFAYVGAEVALGFILENRFAQFHPYYWMMAMVGRFIGALLLLKVPPRKLLVICGSSAVFLLLVTIITSGIISVWSIVMIGLFNSIMFPVIYCLGLNGIGRYSQQGSAVMVMAFCGGGVISFMTENYAAGLGLEYGLIIPMICFAYIISYGLEGSKFRVRNDLPEQTRELL